MDTAWAPPLHYTREQSRRPDYVELKIPTRALPETMAKTNITTRTSIRNELKTTPTIMQAGGASMKDITLSKSSINRKPAKAVKEAATQKKGAFTAQEFGVVHFDGKIVQYADHNTEDRLAVLLSSPTAVSTKCVSQSDIADNLSKCLTSQLKCLTNIYVNSM